jgi:hypothetical protein
MRLYNQIGARRGTSRCSGDFSRTQPLLSSVALDMQISLDKNRSNFAIYRDVHAIFVSRGNESIIPACTNLNFRKAAQSPHYDVRARKTSRLQMSSPVARTRHFDVSALTGSWYSNRWSLVRSHYSVGWEPRFMVGQAFSPQASDVGIRPIPFLAPCWHGPPPSPRNAKLLTSEWTFGSESD